MGYHFCSVMDNEAPEAWHFKSYLKWRRSKTACAAAQRLIQLYGLQPTCMTDDPRIYNPLKKGKVACYGALNCWAVLH